MIDVGGNFDPRKLLQMQPSAPQTPIDMYRSDEPPISMQQSPPQIPVSMQESAPQVPISMFGSPPQTPVDNNAIPNVAPYQPVGNGIIPGVSGNVTNLPSKPPGSPQDRWLGTARRQPSYF